MNKGSVRIEKIEIQNFKNVKNGQINLINNRKKYKSNILGIYGQNGSGKTALIDAIMLLKIALCGQVIPPYYADYIHVEAESAQLKFNFSVEIPEINTLYKVIYEFKLRKEQNDNNQNIAVSEDYKAVISDEVLRCSYINNEIKSIMSPLIKVNEKDILISKSKYQKLIGNSK